MERIPTEKIYKKLADEWDFDKLLEPYKQGGTIDNPVTRTWGTVIDWLINKHKFPADVVGAGIFLVWIQIKEKGDFVFDIDGYDKPVWGSAGKKFVHAIRITCASLMQQKMSEQIFSGMAGQVEKRIKEGFKNDLFKNLPWFVKKFSKSYGGYNKWLAGLMVALLTLLLLAPWAFILNIMDWAKKLI